MGFIGIGLFASYQLFFLASGVTPEVAIEAAAVLISKEVKQPRDMLYLTRMESDSGA